MNQPTAPDVAGKPEAVGTDPAAAAMPNPGRLFQTLQRLPADRRHEGRH